MVMEDNESCGSRVVLHDTSSPAQSQSRQQRQKLQVYNEVLRRLKDSNNDEALLPGFDEDLWAHFNRLPTRYALDVNVERAEDVLTHKRLLHLAHDPAQRPAIEIRLVQVHPTSDGNSDSPRDDAAQSSKLSNRQSIHPPPAFGSSPNLEALALESNKSHDQDDEHSVHANTQMCRPMHEITFSTDDKPKLLSQLTSLLAEIGLNIQEAHAFSTLDGYSLDVFVVDGWPYEETELLKTALEKEVLKIEGPWPIRRSSSSGSDYDQVVIKSEPNQLTIPNDGTDVWEIDPKQLKFGNKVASGSCGDLYKGTYCSQEVAIKVLKPECVNSDMQKDFAQEVFIMRKVRHKNVVQFIGACTKTPSLCIVTEYMSGGSVYDYLHKQKGVFKLPSLLKVAIDVSKGMTYLHQNNIIHRDLKAANLLMDENEVIKKPATSREVLIKSVAMAVPSYPMSIFLMPGTLCKSINSDISNFWWGFSDHKTKVHWKSWDLLCNSKATGGIGFKDLHEFNLALLAKQCWRLVKHPNLLWCRVLKARYFDNSSFLVAKKGSRPSWIWNSLLSGRDSITSKAFWQIRNGRSVDVWRDRWVPNECGGSILPTDTSNRFTPLLVADIIDENREWNVDHLKPFLKSSDFQAIKAIPIGKEEEEDILVWPHSKNGSYSVKSGYHLLHSNTLAQSRTKASTSHQVNKKIWKMVWYSDTTPKISNFLWKAVSGALPTATVLFKRKILKSPMCNICGEYQETIEHCLLLCPWTLPVWFGSNTGYSPNKQSVTSLDEWLLGIQRLVSSNEHLLQLIFQQLLEIWKHRCEIIFNQCSPNPLATIQKTRYNFEAWRLALNSRGSHVEADNNQDAPNLWQPPPPTEVKINIDGAWCSTNHKSGIGIIVRNHQGLSIAGAAITGAYNSAAEAEADAVVKGMQLASNLQLRNIVIESDCKDVITALNSNSFVLNWRISPMIAEALQLKSLFSGIIWSWIPREANRVADAAAKLALSRVVKVADFGVARVISQSGVMTAETGTYRWMAPEVIEHKPYDHKADVFSFGIVLWELLTGKLPYEYLTPLQAAVGVVQKGLRPTIPKQTHPKLTELLEKCWQQDPALRPDFSEIIEMLLPLAKEIGDEGEERRKSSRGFLSVLRRGHH